MDEVAVPEFRTQLALGARLHSPGRPHQELSPSKALRPRQSPAAEAYPQKPKSRSRRTAGFCKREEGGLPHLLPGAQSISMEPGSWLDLQSRARAIHVAPVPTTRCSGPWLFQQARLLPFRENLRAASQKAISLCQPKAGMFTESCIYGRAGRRIRSTLLNPQTRGQRRDPRCLQCYLCPRPRHAFDETRQRSSA